MSAVIDSLSPTTDHPAVMFRNAGDQYVLVEYGDMVPDLQLNLLVLSVAQRLEQNPIDGLIETIPGFRTILLHYDPSQLERDLLLQAVTHTHANLPAISSLSIPSRLVTLPIAFDDATSREAVHRYRVTTRSDAPNVVEGNNIDYICKCNGMANREELYDTILATQWWNTFTGFFPGLPSLFPLDSRRRVSAPKYNPTRMWTAEGTVAIGGPCVVIYPIESPGSYELFGRTLPIFDMYEQFTPAGAEQRLLRPGDRVAFERVDEAHLLELRRQVFEGRYTYRIEPGEFNVHDYLVQEQAHAHEATRASATRQYAASAVAVP